MNRDIQNRLDELREKQQQLDLERERAKPQPGIQDALFELPRAPPKVRKPPDTSRLPKYRVDPDRAPFVCRGKRCKATVRWGWTDRGKETVLNMDSTNHFATCVDRDTFRRKQT